MGVLNPPLDWTPGSTIIKLRDDFFVAAYKGPAGLAAAQQLIDQVGLDTGDVVPINSPNMRQFWRDVFENVAKLDMLRKLTEEAMLDPRNAADNYQTLIKDTLAEDSQDKQTGLTFKERNDLKSAFTEAFSEPAKFRELVETGLKLDPDEFLTGENSISEAVSNLIAYCEDKELLVELFTAPSKLPPLSEMDTGLLNLAVFVIDEVRDAYDKRMSAPIVKKPFEACFLNQGIPFIHRPGIRKSAEELLREDGKRLLVVNGGNGTGKTYSQYFIELLSTPYKFEYCFIELEEEGPGSFNPDDLARRLNSDLHLPALLDQPSIPESPTDPGKLPAKISDWLVRKLEQNDMQYWIALDGFSHKELPEPTRELVNKIIAAVKGTRLPHVRLVLLDYSPEKLGPIPIYEREDIEIVSQADLAEFLIKAFHEKNFAVEADALREKAREIVEGLSNKPEDHMVEIMVKVYEYAQELAAQNG